MVFTVPHILRRLKQQYIAVSITMIVIMIIDENLFTDFLKPSL